MPDFPSLESVQQSFIKKYPDATAKEMAELTVKYRDRFGGSKPFSGVEQMDKEAQFQSSHPVLGAIGKGVVAPVSAGLRGAADMATFGAATPVGAALGAGIGAITGQNEGRTVGEQYQYNKDRLAFSAEQNPASTTAGQLAGAFAPSSPVNQLAMRGAKTAAVIPAMVTEAIERKLVSGYAKTLLGLGGNLASGAAGFAGAATVVNTGFEAPGLLAGDVKAIDVFKQTMEGLNNPLTFAAVTVPALLGAAIRINPDNSALSVMEEAKRLGFKPIAGAAHPEGGYVQRAQDVALRSPFGANLASKLMKEGFYEPLKQDIKRLQDSISSTPRKLLIDQSAENLQNAVAKRTPTVKGSIQSMAEARQNAPDAVAGYAQPTSIGTLRGLVTIAENAKTKREGQYQTSGEIQGDFAKILLDPDEKGSLANVLKRAIAEHDATGSHGVTWQELQNVGHRVDHALQLDGAFAPGQRTPLGPAESRALSDFSLALKQARRLENPKLNNVYTDIQNLHRVADSFKPLEKVAELGDPRQIFDAMVTKTDYRNRWKHFERVYPQSVVQDYRGGYLSDFFASPEFWKGGLSENGRPMILSKRIEKIWEQSGSKFSEGRFDTVLPGVREEISRQGRISDLFARTLGAQEGSQTAPRQMMMEAFTAIGQAPKMVMDLLTNGQAAKTLVGRALGLPGLRRFTRSIIDGPINQHLMDLATGKPFMPLQSKVQAAMAYRRGGATGLASDIGTIGEGIGTGLSNSMDAMMSGSGSSGSGTAIPQSTQPADEAAP